MPPLFRFFRTLLLAGISRARLIKSMAMCGPSFLLLGLIITSCTAPGMPGPDPQGKTPLPASTATLSPAQVDATEGAMVQATRRVQATKDAQATSESQLVTATAARQLTQQAAETALLQLKAQQLAAAQASWQPVVSDSFTDNSLDWPLGPKQDDSLAISTLIEGGKYLWTVVDARHDNSYWNLIPANSPVFNNFYVRVNLELRRGEQDGSYAYGLVFRHANDDYGFFGLRSDGHFQVLAVFDTSIYQDIVMSSAAILPDQANQIGVRGSGSDFIFLINGQPVWYMNEDLPPGEIGLGVEVMIKGTEEQVAFTDFVVSAAK